MEGACTCGDGGPKTMPKPWKGWDKKKEVHPFVVTVSLLRVLTEAGAGVA